MPEYRTRPARGGGYDLLIDGKPLGWVKTPEQAGDLAEQHRQSLLPPDEAALRRVMLMAYAGVGGISTSYREDYEQMDQDLRRLAELAGVRYETPDYVEEIIDVCDECGARPKTEAHADWCDFKED